MATVDFNKPVAGDSIANYTSEIVTAIQAQARMFSGDTLSNIPDGAIRWSTTNHYLEIYSAGGGSWSELDPRISSHIASTSNPHSTTAAQVGAPTTATFNAHASSTSNPHSTTAAQVGAPDLSAFNAHTSNTSNPHSTTAGQVGALSIANALSELAATAGTARSSIGAAAAATLSAHLGDTSNPHNVTRGQIGAAASGANNDITSLGACGSLIRAGIVTIGTSDANTLRFRAGGADLLILDALNNFFPSTTGAMNLGTASFAFNGLTVNAIRPGAGSNLRIFCADAGADIAMGPGNNDYWVFLHGGGFSPTVDGGQDIGITGSNRLRNVFFKGKLRNEGTAQVWSFFPFSDTSSLDPSAAGGSYSQSVMQATMNAVNSIAKRLENLGLFN